MYSEKEENYINKLIKTCWRNFVSTLQGRVPSQRVLSKREHNVKYCKESIIQVQGFRISGEKWGTMYQDEMPKIHSLGCQS